MTSIDQAEAAERAAFSEIGRLGEIEVARVKKWIAGDCEAPHPVPDVAARRAAHDRLAAAMEARQAAERASGGRGGADGYDARPDGEIAATGTRCGGATAKET